MKNQHRKELEVILQEDEDIVNFEDDLDLGEVNSIANENPEKKYISNRKESHHFKLYKKLSNEKKLSCLENTNVEKPRFTSFPCNNISFTNAINETIYENSVLEKNISENINYKKFCSEKFNMLLAIKQEGKNNFNSFLSMIYKKGVEYFYYSTSLNFFFIKFYEEFQKFVFQNLNSSISYEVLFIDNKIIFKNRHENFQVKDLNYFLDLKIMNLSDYDFKKTIYYHSVNFKYNNEDIVIKIPSRSSYSCNRFFSFLINIFN